MAWTSAQFITLADLYIAYRKAKVDSFYERDQAQALLFAEYERNLDVNLRSLLALVNTATPRWMRQRRFVGGFSYLPKTLAAKDPDTPRAPDSFVHADADAAWTAFAKRIPHSSTFRIVGQPPIPFHVVSALWIQKVGHLYDAVLSRHAYAARVRRRHRRSGEGFTPSDTTMGSFKPYQYGYREWRLHGLTAIRKSLIAERSLIVVTADLKRFYHETSPDFLLSKDFLRSFGLNLSPDQRLFTRQLVTAIRTWAKNTPDHGEQPRRGLPVGLSASRLIANVVLAGLDRLITQQLKPIHYGRYVDDVLLGVLTPRSVSD